MLRSVKRIWVRIPVLAVLDGSQKLGGKVLHTLEDDTADICLTILAIKQSPGWRT